MSAAHESERKWKWCVCTRGALADHAKCAHCGKSLGFHYEIPMEYAGKHWHISCLLDTLTASAGDNPTSPIFGLSAFHP